MKKRIGFDKGDFFGICERQFEKIKFPRKWGLKLVEAWL